MFEPTCPGFGFFGFTGFFGLGFGLGFGLCGGFGAEPLPVTVPDKAVSNTAPFGLPQPVQASQPVPA